MTDRDRPKMFDLWKQAGGGTPDYDRERYLQLMRDHGHLVPIVDDEDAPRNLPCGWPGRPEKGSAS